MNRDKNNNQISSSCTLDCWDSCSIMATVLDNEIISLKGDPRNHITGKFLCEKGRRHVDMMNHPDRLRQPLLKKSHGWEKISWDQALDLVASKLDSLRNSQPSTALVHWSHSGNVGLLKSLENRFFSAYGGVSTPIGNLCAGAGNAAQRFDFGRVLSHEASDVVNSKTIIIWGRNPMDTGIHLVPFLKEAKKNGAYIILIDPIESSTRKLADMHISPLPGTDSALALSIANILIKNGLIDKSFIENHVVGYGEFKEYVQDFTLELGSKITGVPIEDIETLANQYGKSKPSSIIVGFGVQRYTNSGYTVRSIDALGAISGNIGIKGGGVNYNNQRMDDYIDHELLSGQLLRKHHRTFNRPEFAEFLEEARDPEIEMIFITRANPITQCMDTNKMIKSFKKIKFKVTIDMFKTDTANLSDLILPCRHSLEEINLINPPAIHNYINLCNKVVDPDPWLPSELWIWNELAKRLELDNFPIKDEFWWLENALKPMTDLTGLTIDDLKSGPVILPGAKSIPWQDKKFDTPSGKYELYSNSAKEQGFQPLPIYKDLSIRKTDEYPFYLLTLHTKDSINSQHFLLAEVNQVPIVYINREMASEKNIKSGNIVQVYTETGSLDCIVECKENIKKDIVMIHEGWWLQRSGGVNKLTSEKYSDIGKNAAYYECLCNIR